MVTKIEQNLINRITHLSENFKKVKTNLLNKKDSIKDPEQNEQVHIALYNLNKILSNLDSLNNIIQKTTGKKKNDIIKEYDNNFFENIENLLPIMFKEIQTL